MNKNSKLESLRKEIDSIDCMIIKLIEKRFNKSKKIGCIKRMNNDKINDEKREKEIINNLLKCSRVNPIFIKRLYDLIFKESRKIQNDK